METSGVSEPVLSEAESASLQATIQRAATLLPIPGPITGFAFLNTLQTLEDRPFDEGLRLGAKYYGAQPFMSEERYRTLMARGRIRPEDLSAALLELLDDSADLLLGRLGTRYELRLARLMHAVPSASDDELRWFIAESDALNRFREEVPDTVRERFVEETRHWVLRDLRDTTPDEGAVTKDSAKQCRRRTRQVLGDLIPKFAPSSIEHWSDPKQEWESLSLKVLWRVCYDGALRAKIPQADPVLDSRRHRDLLLEATGADCDNLVHDVLIKFCAAFTDQGLAQTPMPRREEGFFRGFCSLYRDRAQFSPRWLRGLPDELDRIQQTGMSPLESIAESLEQLGVPPAEWEEFLAATLLALRGWAGLLWQMEIRQDRYPQPVRAGALVEFLAIRLILDRLAAAWTAADKLDFTGPVNQLRTAVRARLSERGPASAIQRALLVFQLAQLRGWSPAVLHQLSDTEWSLTIAEFDAFNSFERRRVFHRAFERRLQVRAFDALSVHRRFQRDTTETPRFQAAFCIDAREESFRRHLEEVAPDVETFGLAGFFGVPIYYRGAGDAHFTALCPIVIKPKHWVVEDVAFTFGESHKRRAMTRRPLGTASHKWQIATNSPGLGAILSTAFGVLASIPLLGRVLFPRIAARLRRLMGSFIEPPPMTRLRLERFTPHPGPGDEEIGFTVEEMAEISERMLREIGLTDNFSRIVFFMGHGATALNNPHKSAYDCGACSGSPGGPNARALAAMLNDQRVRAKLAKTGLHIPDDTIFIGGLHNTTKDTLSFYDLDRLQQSHYHDFEEAVKSLEEACLRNAHERCRRFDSAPVDLSFSAAHLHVEGRSEDLAQTRPEFGNATNAFCVVGRRNRTRGLFLDRRCFLASYDPTQDDEDARVLTRILSAVVPVCEGINMTYFLSATDSPGWSCGTKLPHNVTSLLGVMDGAASDLRPGLPWQSVEIHEPVRLTFIIETTPEVIRKIMEQNPTIRRILSNGWSLLAVISPDSNAIQVYHHGEFLPYRPESGSLPSATCSTEWYRGWRDHLGFAEINAAEPSGTSCGSPTCEDCNSD
ncbi:MAG: DUF2309 domain-containing protein [Planctomycetes bacterium]|nr:DUF2309 domain-containing protein [Planctomycetota bacterium]